MKQWIKLESNLMDDPRIAKLIDTNLGFAGLGIYVALRLKLENQAFQRMHINMLRQICNRKAGFSRVNHVINDFDLFWVDGNGDVSLRPRDNAGDNAGDNARDFSNIDEKRKEINKEIFEENGNHDFDSRWI